MFVVFLLMQYILEIDPDSAERPTFKSERMGTGVMHPKGDLRVILRTRRCHDNHVLRFSDMPGKTKRDGTRLRDDIDSHFPLCPTPRNA